MKSLIFTSLFLISLVSNAQDSTAAKSWECGAAFGLNLSHTWIVNPKPSSGKQGFSTNNSLDLNANYIKENSKFKATNEIHWQVALYKAGIDGSPIQKSADEVLTLNDWSRSFSKNNKWNFNLIVKCNTSILTVFEDNYLTDVKNNDGKIQEFLSPYEVTLSPGIKYQPNKHFRVSVSPYSVRMYGVKNQKIADTGLYTTDVKADGHYVTFLSERQGADVNIWFDYKIKKWCTMQYRLGVKSNYFENLLKNGQADGLFITKIKLVGNLSLMHRGTLKANFADMPFKPLYMQTVTLSYTAQF